MTIATLCASAKRPWRCSRPADYGCFYHATKFGDYQR